MSDDSRYVHALRFKWLTRLYDPLMHAFFKEEKFKRMLVEQAALRPGHRVLDLGCGTATLTVMLKSTCPGAEVFGLDGDAEILAIARRKAQEAGVELDLRHGIAWEPPFEPGSFDRVVTSLVLHHLTSENKRKTLAAARRLLKADGELHIADWGRAQNVAMRAAFLAVQTLDGFDTTADNVAGRLPGLIEEAGFSSVAETHREMTAFGTLSLYRASAK